MTGVRPRRSEESADAEEFPGHPPDPALRRTVLASADSGPTDGQLLGEFIHTRDEAAVAALVRRHGPIAGQLLDAKWADDHVLDTLSAAVLGRLPTESERAFVLGSVG
jgi:hypothetical protein